MISVSQKQALFGQSHKEKSPMADNDQYEDRGTQDDGTQALAQAAPEEVDAHRDMLSQALGMLGGQGVNVQSLLGQAGAGETNPSQMSHSDLVSTTMALAQQHPEVLAMVASRFPQAAGLIGMLTGGQGGQNPQGAEGGGGMLGGLLGKFGL